MLFPGIVTTDPSSVPGPVPPYSLAFTLEPQVQNALNLFLPLKNRVQMPALLKLLAETQTEVHEALKSLHYVHFARFLPSTDGSVLMVITEYDGGLESYIMDFVAVLGETFTAVLQFIADAPPLPVQSHAREFTKFIMEHDLRQVGVWSAYPEITVIDILRGARHL